MFKNIVRWIRGNSPPHTELWTYPGFYPTLALATVLFLIPSLSPMFKNFEIPKIKISGTQATEQVNGKDVPVFETDPSNKTKKWPVYNLDSLKLDWNNKTSGLDKLYAITRSPLRPHFAVLMVLGFLLTTISFWFLGKDRDLFDLEDILPKVIIIQIPIVLMFIFMVCFSVREADIKHATETLFQNPSFRTKVFNELNYQKFILICGGIFGTFILDVLAALCLGLVCSVYEEAKEKIEKRIKAQFLFPNEEIVVIRGDVVRIMKMIPKIRWWPIPIIGSEQREIALISISCMVECLRGESIRNAMALVNRRLAEIVPENMTEQAELVSGEFAKRILKKLGKNMVTRVQSLSNGEGEAHREQARHVLQRTSEVVLERFKQELLEDVMEKMSAEIMPFKREVLENLHGQILRTKTKFHGNFSPVLPPNTRFFAEQGPLAMIAVEQPPHVRTVAWNNNALDPDNCQGGVTCFKLAMPYVIYVFKFWKNDLSGFQVYFRTAPLTDPENQLLHPNLPNMHGNCTVCMPKVNTEGMTIAQTVEAVINSFWSSSFNNDLSHYYRKGRWAHGDLKDVHTWQTATEKNPQFILQASFLQPHGSQSLKSAWEAAVNSAETEQTEGVEKLAQKALKEGEARLRDIVMKHLNSVQTKRRYKKVVANSLDQALRQSAQQVADFIFNEAVVPLQEPADDDDTRREFTKALGASLGQIAKEEKCRLSSGTVESLASRDTYGPYCDCPACSNGGNHLLPHIKDIIRNHGMRRRAE